MGTVRADEFRKDVGGLRQWRACGPAQCLSAGRQSGCRCHGPAPQDPLHCLSSFNASSLAQGNDPAIEAGV